MPRITGLLETALYVGDMDRAVAFYETVLGLRTMTRGDRLTALDAGSRGVLLLFLRGGTGKDLHLSRGTIPGHDGSGPLHLAFAVPAGRLDQRARGRAAGAR